MENLELLDFGDYPNITAAGIADFYMLGSARCRYVFFDWFKVDGVLRRHIVGTVTRQAENLADDYRRFWPQIKGH